MKSLLRTMSSFEYQMLMSIVIYSKWTFESSSFGSFSLSLYDSIHYRAMRNCQRQVADIEPNTHRDSLTFAPTIGRTRAHRLCISSCWHRTPFWTWRHNYQRSSASEGETEWARELVSQPVSEWTNTIRYKRNHCKRNIVSVAHQSLFRVHCLSDNRNRKASNETGKKKKK